MTQSSVLRIWSAVQTENLHLRGGKSSNAPDGLVTAILCSAVSADMLIAFRKGQQGRVLYLIAWEHCAQRNQVVGAELASLCPRHSDQNEIWRCLKPSGMPVKHWLMFHHSCELSCPLAGPRVMIFTHASMWWSGKCPRLAVSRTERASCSPTIQKLNDLEQVRS